MSRDPIYIGNDHDIFVKGLRLAGTREYDNTAALLLSLYDAGGSPIADAQNLTMVYQNDTENLGKGTYRGVIPAAVTATLTLGANYTAVVTGSNRGLQWEYDLQAAKRKSRV